MLFNLLATGEITSEQLRAIVEPILTVTGLLVPILLSVVGGVGAIWCIVLGVKYSKADDPQEHEKAKSGLKNAIIGYILIFVLLIMLQVGQSVLNNWWAGYTI